MEFLNGNEDLQDALRRLNVRKSKSKNKRKSMKLSDQDQRSMTFVDYIDFDKICSYFDQIKGSQDLRAIIFHEGYKGFYR